MASAPARPRLPAIDFLKALAIVAVVFTHAGRFDWGGPHYDWDFFLSMLWTPFHVPTFLFFSGFLYARSEPVALDTVRARLTRVLLPYLVASLAALALGTTGARCGGGNALSACVGDVAFDLVTASSQGVDYYIWLLVICISLIGPLSRMPRPGVWVFLGFCLAYTVAVDVDSSLRLAMRYGHDFVFWSLRDPFDNFQLPAFLMGWLAALNLPALLRLHERHPRAVVLALLAMVTLGLCMTANLVPPLSHGIKRALYTTGVIGLVSLAVRARTPGRTVMFLSEASLGLYLFHRIFQVRVAPWTDTWPDPLRILGQVGFGLGGAALVLLAARRLLGHARARRWLGA